jgi:hypothetical protein
MPLLHLVERGLSRMTDRARSVLLSLVERELVGPSDVREVIQDNPQRRYVVGQLATSSDGGLIGIDDEIDYDASALSIAEDSDVLSIDPPTARDEEDPNADGDEPVEDSASIAKARRDSLSSIGVSFVIESGVSVTYEIAWGQYSRTSDGQFVREPKLVSGDITLDGPCYLSERRHERVTLKWVARALRGRLIVSLFVLNATDPSSKDGTERLYQVTLRVCCSETTEGFLSRSDLANDRMAHESDANDLLFRKRKEYGIGLHTAVRPTLSKGGSACFELQTESLPFADTRVTVSREFTSGTALDMTWLSTEREPVTTCMKLRNLFHGYSKWANDLETEAKGLPARFADLAAVQIGAIEERVRRLDEGIATLESDPIAYASFRVANEVMARAQYRASADVRSHYKQGEPMDEGGKDGSWFPFQLAFLISVLPDFVNSKRPQRNLVDVLFFPTGGGKTEAYLGLAIFAAAYRRMAPDAAESGAGISTLMRYTLRLLTTQQFTRAATAVCAAEAVRRDGTFGSALGGEPFSIGLWVGPMTPQNFKGAVKAVGNASKEHFECPRGCELSRDVAKATIPTLGKRDEEANVLPITECPWCFSMLCVECLELDHDAERLIIRCPNQACLFHRRGPGEPGRTSVDGLPLFVVDADVYRMCPTIVIATVDKFATLPFRGEAKALFGRVSKYCETCGYLTDATVHKRKHPLRHSAQLQPFDLIIQDELHTITDNLGSIYGLFETSVELLARRDGISPKYVCATATVKAVESQVRNLYGQRGCSVFPPQGLESGDSYFSVDQEGSIFQPGRRYVGIYAPTFSRLSTFVAVLSAILASAWRVRETEGADEADPYLTLLGYFNTIRDLGSVKGLLGDDVPPVLRATAARNGWETRELSTWQEELTGRISASEVPARLRALQTKFEPLMGCDYMAATNMISVGVDVPRLGAMIVDGQPKTTAEYIQATSRVGRKHAGIVFVVYNAMRPRDISHYEHFYAYHDSFYKFVEAGSITPFSDGAIDRYLSGAFVASYRLLASASDNDSASVFAHDPGLASTIAEEFQKRATAFGEHSGRSARIALDDVRARWSSTGSTLKYVIYRNPYEKNSKLMPISARRETVLRPADDEPNPAVDALFVAPRSMRNVEAEVPLKVFVEE